MSQYCDEFVLIEDNEDSFEMWQGIVGPYYTPSISSAGILHWTNNGDLPNPPDFDLSGNVLSDAVTFRPAFTSSNAPDMDNVNVPGYYYKNNGFSMAHGVNSAAAKIVVLYRASSGGVGLTQMWFDVRANELYFRTQYNSSSGYSAWRRVADASVVDELRAYFSQNTAALSWAVGSVDLDSGNPMTSVVNRLYNQTLSVVIPGDKIWLTPFGVEQGYSFNAFFYAESGGSLTYLGHGTIGTVDQTVPTGANRLRLTLAKSGVSDMTPYLSAAPGAIAISQSASLNLSKVAAAAEQNAEDLRAVAGTELLSPTTIGSLDLGTGAFIGTAVNRFVTDYISVNRGARIRLTQYGRDNGFGFNCFKYNRTYSTNTSFYKPFNGQTGYGTVDVVVDDINCALIRLTIGQTGVSNVTGMEADFSGAVEVVPAMEDIRPNYLFPAELTRFEDFFVSATSYNQADITAAQLLALFDAQLSEKFTVISTGTDDFGNTLKAYKWSPRQKGYLPGHVFTAQTLEPVPYPKVMVVCNIHGSERSPAFSALKLVELLNSNTHVNDSIDFIKTNVELVIVPVANPSGWDAKTYENGNGVNLNRDFPPSGPVQTDPQPETAFIRSVLADEEEGLCFYFDFHNTWWNELNTGANADNPVQMPILGYVYTDSHLFRELGMNIYNAFKARVNVHESTPTDWFTYAESARKGTSAVWAQSQGVPGTLFEISRKFPTLDNTEWGNDVIIWGVCLLCAFINNAVYTLRFKGVPGT